MSSSLIDEIREVVDSNGMTVKELAGIVGVTDQYLYRVFRKEQVPSIQIIEKVLKGLGCTLRVVRD